MITFEVKGLKEMGDKLAQLPGKIGRKILARAVFEGARLIRTEGRARAPVGTKTYRDWRGKVHRPGLLKKSGVMAKKLKTRDWQRTVVYGIGFSKRGYYGKWIERGKSKRHRQAARPFVVPLLESKGREVVDVFTRSLGDQLTELIKETPGLEVRHK